MHKRPLTLTRSFYNLLSLGLTLSLSFSLISPVYASPVGDEIETLIRQDLFANQQAIQTKASELSSTERELLYQRNEKNALTGSLLNLLPIFGYGSYQQGDLVGGITLSVLDGIGYALLATAIIYTATTPNTGGYGGLALGGVGVSSFLVGRIAGVISPQVHGNLYNTTLQQSLSASTAPVSLSPSNISNYPLLAFGQSF